MNHIRITPDLLGRLAAAVTPEMRHTQKLDAFAAVLGFPHQTALMRTLATQPPYVPALNEMMDDLLFDAFRRSTEADVGFLSTQEHATWNMSNSLEEWRSDRIRGLREQCADIEGLFAGYLSAPETACESAMLSLDLNEVFYAWKTITESVEVPLSRGEKAALPGFGIMAHQADKRTYMKRPDRQGIVTFTEREIRTAWGRIAKTHIPARVLSKPLITKMAKTANRKTQAEDHLNNFVRLAGYQDRAHLEMSASPPVRTYTRPSESEKIQERRDFFSGWVNAAGWAEDALSKNAGSDQELGAALFFAKEVRGHAAMHLRNAHESSDLSFDASQSLLARNLHMMRRILRDRADPWVPELLTRCPEPEPRESGTTREDDIVVGLLRREASGPEVLTQKEIRDIFKGPQVQKDTLSKIAAMIALPFFSDEFDAVFTYLSVAYPEFIRCAGPDESGKLRWRIEAEVPGLRCAMVKPYLETVETRLLHVREGSTGACQGEIGALLHKLRAIGNGYDQANPSEIGEKTRTLSAEIHGIITNREDAMTGSAMRQLMFSSEDIDSASYILDPSGL